jgi:hypothetical protein
MAQALVWLSPLLAWCTLLTWGLHVLSMLAALQMGRAPQWLLGRGEGIVAVLAILAWMAVEIDQIRQTPQAWRIYGVAVVGGTVWAYVRLLWVGLAPIQVWDTVALIGVSYALFILQRFVQSQPLFHVVLLLPLLVLPIGIRQGWLPQGRTTVRENNGVAKSVFGMLTKPGSSEPLKSLKNRQYKR